MNPLVTKGEVEIRSFLNNDDFTPLVLVCDNQEVNMQLIQIFKNEFRDKVEINLANLPIIDIRQGCSKIFAIMSNQEFEGYNNEIKESVRVYRL